MGYLGYPSPRGVHVPETYPNNGDNDPYLRESVHSPRRDRYSRSVHQTPRARNLTWVSSSPVPTPPSLYAPSTPRLPPPQMPSSPAHRPSSVIPPSPAPTVGEHMAVDDVVFAPDDFIDPYTYQPRRQGGSAGLIKSFWKGLKKLSGLQSTPRIPRISSYGSQTVEMPVPRPSTPSEAMRYENPTPPGTDQQRDATPYTSPYVRPTNLVATPAVIPGSLRRSPVPIPSVDVPPPITIISPSIPPSPHPNSVRSARMASPAMGAIRNPSVGGLEPVMPSVEEGSQTLHEPVPVRLPFPTVLGPLTEELKLPTSSGAPALDFPSPKGSLSTSARFRRFIAGLDGLPWVSDTQIADMYYPERNQRSQMRKRVRQGAEPSWYNARPEVVERPEYWAEWDMWAKQSAAALWNGVDGEGRAVGWSGIGGPGQWGVTYPHGYVPTQPGLVYPSGYPPPGMMSDQRHAPVLP